MMIYALSVKVPLRTKQRRFVVMVPPDLVNEAQVHTAVATEVTVPAEMVMSEVVVTSHDAALVMTPV